MRDSDKHKATAASAPRRARLNPLVAGWTNIALGLLIGCATAIGVVAGSLGGAESPFFILVACLLVAVGTFSLAVRPVPVIILGVSLLLLGSFLGFGLLVGGSVLGAADGGITTVVGVVGLLLAALEAWAILAVWRTRKRRMPAVEVTEPQGEAENRAGS